MTAPLQILPGLTSFIFLASMKATVLIALVLLVQRVTRRYLSAGARYSLWFIVVLSLVTPVGFDNRALAPLLPAARLPTLQPALAAPEHIDAMQTTPAQMDPVPRAGLQAPFSSPAATGYVEPERMTETLPAFALAWLPYLWLAGVAFVLGAITLSSIRFARIVRRAVLAPAELQRLLRECMRQTSCTRGVQVLCSAEVAVPMIAGVFRPLLLMPRGLDAQLTRTQLRHVFLHELMHLQRGDIAGNWIVALVQALHWFNPAVWFAFFRMRQDRELACDAATLEYLAPAERTTYGYTLLQLNDALPHTPVPAVALGVLETRSHLEERIVTLTHGARYGKRRTFAAALVALPLAAIAFSQPAPPAAPVASMPVAERVTEVSAAEPIAVAAEALPAAAAPPAFDAEPAAVLPRRLPISEPSLRSPEAPAVDTAPSVMRTNASPAVPPGSTTESVQLLAAASTVMLEPYAGLGEIQQLGMEIEAAKPVKLAFIEGWNEVANACAERRDKFMGSFAKPCRQMTMAMARGEISRLAYECWVLATRQQGLRDAYEEAAMAGNIARAAVDTALAANERTLASFCAKDMFASQYPAFATLLAEAEQKYTPDGRRRFAVRSELLAAHDDGMYMSGWVPGTPAVESYASGGYPVAAGAYYGGNTDGAVVGAGGMGGGDGGGGAVAPAPAQ